MLNLWVIAGIFPELLSKADCLVLSTITQEAFGRVIIEAQAPVCLWWRHGWEG